MQLKTSYRVITGLMGLVLLNNVAQAAVSMDRTRVIFDGNQKSISLNIANNNK